MIQSRLIVSILFLFSFFAYYLYHYNIAMIGMSNNRDDRTYNPLIVTQHFHHSSNFFICKPHHDYCERTASSEWNMIRAQIYTILNRRLNKDPQSIFTRDDIPNIIPPLPETGCESKDDFARVLCEGNVQRIIKIAACVGAGLVTVPAIFFIAWTLARWIRVVRPRKETILIGKEAKKRAVGLTGRASWARGGGHIQELFLGKESYLNEKSLSGSGAKKARNRIEEKEVWYGGVRMTIPWKRGENWNHAVSWCCKFTIMED
jgi:hypothetical protein